MYWHRDLVSDFITLSDVNLNCALELILRVTLDVESLIAVQRVRSQLQNLTERYSIDLIEEDLKVIMRHAIDLNPLQDYLQVFHFRGKAEEVAGLRELLLERTEPFQKSANFLRTPAAVQPDARWVILESQRIQIFQSDSCLVR